MSLNSTTFARRQAFAAARPGRVLGFDDLLCSPSRHSALSRASSRRRFWHSPPTRTCGISPGRRTDACRSTTPGFLTGIGTSRSSGEAEDRHSSLAWPGRCHTHRRRRRWSRKLPSPGRRADRLRHPRTATAFRLPLPDPWRNVLMVAGNPPFKPRVSLPAAWRAYRMHASGQPSIGLQLSPGTGRWPPRKR